MILPGFTAEASLYRGSGYSYELPFYFGRFYAPNLGKVVPQQPPEVQSCEEACERRFRDCLDGCRDVARSRSESCQVECWYRYTDCERHCLPEMLPL
jgi:hypothetical protein